DYGGDINVQVYADTDGWLVAYLKMDEPIAKIMQWKTADVSNPKFGAISTTLEDALIKAGEAANVGIVKSDIKYYDFEFPNANSMMIFVRTRSTDGSNICQVKIPADYTLFEASYYYYIYYYSNYDKGASYRHTYWASYLWVKEVSTENWVKINVASTAYQGDWKYKWWRAIDTYKGEITPGTLYTIWVSYTPKERDGKNIEGAVDKGSAGVATVLIYRTA
ncbi:MAG: hypothetical protein KAT65_08480, partial [Methanophagales archaeon]|nr:hypothetical protein [Methanophagales archaeon]